mgnify:FL=1
MARSKNYDLTDHRHMVYYSHRSPEMTLNGRLAQLGEHLLDVQRVSGSSPLASTKRKCLQTRMAQWIEGIFIL